MKKKLYTIMQWTWGLPQTLIGSAVWLAHRKNRHFFYKGACVTEWDRDAGLSLGGFVFVPKGSADPDCSCGQKQSSGSHPLLDHEYGHTLQSLILGPAYLLLVGAPSVIWHRHPYFSEKRKKTGKSYYSAVFEKTANILGRADLR